MCHPQIVHLTKNCEERTNECRDGFYDEEKSSVEPGEFDRLCYRHVRKDGGGSRSSSVEGL